MREPIKSGHVSDLKISLTFPTESDQKHDPNCDCLRDTPVNTDWKQSQPSCKTKLWGHSTLFIECLHVVVLSDSACWPRNLMFSHQKISDFFVRNEQLWGEETISEMTKFVNVKFCVQIHHSATGDLTALCFSHRDDFPK